MSVRPVPRGGERLSSWGLPFKFNCTVCLGGRERRAIGYAVQNNSQGYEWFFVPRAGCIFVDSDSSLKTPVTEPRHVCAVYKALGHRLPAEPHTTLRGGKMGHLGPISKMEMFRT